MTDKYQNKYRISSARLYNWDYGANGAYFITVCTHNRVHYFGDIINGKIQLSKIGKIVNAEWLKTFDMRPDMNLIMDEYVIMPNHFYAIIIIGENQYNTERYDIRDTQHDTQHDTQCDTQCRDAMHCVSTDTNIAKNKFGPQSKNLASIIRGFKIGVTKNARQIHADFAWQSRFYDHIIRNNESYHRIQNYIINNPMNWNKDKFHE